MALVMLPCDMPWWSSLQRLLTQAAQSTCSQELIPCMLKIVNLCYVGLDDCDEHNGESTLSNLEHFLLTSLTESQRVEFFKSTLPLMVGKALNLKNVRPPSGLQFSIQQLGDRVEFEREFFTSLLAHAFFSCFPKRTTRTHPTLLDFNFYNFFGFLDSNFQQQKLKTFIHYFNIVEKLSTTQRIIVSRQVLTGGEWLTLDDWVSCQLPLCPLYVKRQGSLFDAPTDHFRVAPASPHIGYGALSSGDSLECCTMAVCPEALCLLLFTESLEDNEALLVEGVVQVASPPCPSAPLLHPLTLILDPTTVSLCWVDADEFGGLVSEQYEQDCVLRETNKALTGFRQGRPVSRVTLLPRRLSPIGESFSSTPEGTDHHHSTRLPSPPNPRKVVNKRELDPRRKFIVLGSSGECLPVCWSGCRTSPAPSLSPEFFSARSSFTDTEEEGSWRRCGAHEKEERSTQFAQRLKEALDRAERADAPTISQHSVLSREHWAREGSCGFVLDKSEGDLKERQYMAPSSNYSFTTDLASEVSGWCEEVGRWLQQEEEGAGRQEAVMELAGSLLKRTLSETWAGVHLPGAEPPLAARPTLPPHAPRSLSLELARNRIAAHLVCRVVQGVSEGEHSEGVRPVATYNWGCGRRAARADPQLKLLTQWMAASAALLPHLLYYTAAHPTLNMVDTVCRVVVDRQWSVGELAGAVVSYSQARLVDIAPQPPSLFEYIICADERPALTHYPPPSYS